MIVQRWKLNSEHPADWLDIQHYGHFSELERGGQLAVAQLSLERVEFPDPFSTRTGQVEGAQFFGTFEDINRTVLESAQLVRGGNEDLRDVFVSGRFLPYTIAFLRESGDPNWPCEKVIYKLRRMHHATQAYCPAPEQLRPSEPYYQQYLRDQMFFFSLEGGGFVASDASREHFFLKTLPSHLETSYFLVFLIALQQRFSLIAMSADVARHWQCETRGRIRTELRKVFERTRDRLFDFTARYYFLQVVQRENHHLCYQRWQAVFETRALYDEVSMEVHEMSEYLRDVDRQNREDRVGLMTLLLTVLIGAPSLAIGFWNINIEGFTASEGFGVWTALAAVGGLSAAIATGFSLLWAVIRFSKNSDS